MANITELHDKLTKNAKRSLAFGEQEQIHAWRKSAKEKLLELLNMPEKNCSLDILVEQVVEHETFTETRFSYQSEQDFWVPAILCVLKNKGGKVPVIICLQGHSPGMRISMGVAVSPDEEWLFEGDRDFCLQAIEQGYAALAVELRCFGEQSGNEHFTAHGSTGCQCDTMVASLLGRTMIGERVFDIMRAIDALEQFAGLDLDRLGIMGNSGGGTVSYYAAAVEDRIKAVMPSCSVCTFDKSIIAHYHCVDNYIFGIMNYFEMQDIAGLIAPKKMVIVAGIEDDIFEYQGVLEAFAKIKDIYAQYNVEDNLRLVSGEGGHRFYAEQGWGAFREITGW